MADENNALLEAIDKLTEAVDGLEDAVKAHPDAETKAKVTECLAQVQKGLDGLFALFPEPSGGNLDHSAGDRSGRADEDL